MQLKKIYHIADIHIRNVKRHKEYRQVFTTMLDEIKKRGVDDSIIYLAGDIAHAKLEMSPELVKEISWLFTECSKLCTTILIAGNHDCNMNNSDRLDVLSPIVDALDLPNFHYLRDTQIFKYADAAFGVYSIFDIKDNWPKPNNKEFKGVKHKIALFHGPVDHAKTDIGYIVSSRHFTTDIFDGYDLALLGDIHKRQEMISPKGCKIVYPGSLVQQNFGETLNNHGFIVWDMDSYTYEEVNINNDYGYYTLDITDGIIPMVSDMPKHARLRIKLTNTNTAQTKKVITKIKYMYGIDDFTVIRTDAISKLKTGDRGNQLEFEDVTEISYQNMLITEYVERMLPFVSPEDLEKIQELNVQLNSRIVQEDVHRNIIWKPILFEFSNMFSYGENNVIDFTKRNGLVGLFAPNATGKSSLFDSISFCLYDKCSRAFKAQNILNNRKKQFQCKLKFKINDIDYFIERTARTVNKGRNVKVDVQFWKEEGGVICSLNGNERRDTNAVIEQYVGTYDDFVLTALSVQGNNALFIDKSQSERKDLLAQFMGLTIFDKLYEMASEDIKEVSTLIRNFKKIDFTDELSDKLKKLSEQKTILKSIYTNSSELSDEKNKIITNLLTLNKQIVKIDTVSDLKSLTTKHSKLIVDLAYMQNEKIETNKIIQNVGDAIRTMSESVKHYETVNSMPVQDAAKKFQTRKAEEAVMENSIAMLDSQIKSNMEKLSHLEKHEYDPNCKFCVNNIFVKDAIDTKQKLADQYTELEELKENLKQIGAHIKPIELAERVWEQYTHLKNSIGANISKRNTNEANLRTIDAKIELITTQIATASTDIKRYHDNEDIIDNNKKIKTQIAQLDSDRRDVEKKISKLNKEINETNTNIGSLSSFIDTIREKINNVKDLEEKNRLYSYYLDTIKRDGIPYELISKALPIIQNEVNNILAQVVDFGAVMQVDGKNINAKIVYEDQEWPLEMSSGMEKFISGLAIRVALINICNLPRPNFLVIDEGMGTLDSDNLNSLYMLLQYLKTQFEFVLIISHIDNIRDYVDELIEIKKENGFSKINF